MSPNSLKIDIKNIQDWKQKILQFSLSFSHVAILDSCDEIHANQLKEYDFLAAFGNKKSFHKNSQKFFEELTEFTNNNWCFGYFAYDLKNQIEDLNSSHNDITKFPYFSFFIPEIVITIKENILEISAEKDSKNILDSLENFSKIFNEKNDNTFIEVKNFTEETPKKKYIAQVEKIKEHLAKGDIYELNFCIEMNADANIQNPLFLFQELISKSPAPFASFLKINEYYILSTSPERYLKKIGNTLYSQPIKGTSKRYQNKVADEQSKKELLASEKERAENVMIVDLVRNDLSRTCQPGTVNVDELFGIYSYTHVHQMVSTISGILEENYSGIDAIKNSFPMGSMTGAPKISAMNLIEEYEDTKRGAYSGALGFFAPNGDFDFNVLIRSIFYNDTLKTIKTNAGSAITFDSEIEKEYEECLLKLAAMKDLLEKIH